MSKLNDDCLCHIFQYLSPFDKLAVSKVNESFAQLISRTWSHRELEINYDKSFYCGYSSIISIKGVNVLEIIKLAGSRIKDLDLLRPIACGEAFVKFSYDELYKTKDELELKAVVEHLDKYATKINSFLFGFEPNFTTYYHTLLSSFKELKILKIDNISGEFEEDNNQLFDLCQTFDTINELIFYCLTPQSKALTRILKRLPALKSLKLDVIYFNNTLFSDISNHAKQLKVLKMEFDYIEYDAFPAEYPENNPLSCLVDLEELQLDQCRVSVTDVNLVGIAYKCSKLKKLTLSLLSISSSALAEALLALENLEYLHLNILCNSYNLKIYKELIKLRTLKIEASVFSTIESKSLIHFIKKVPILSKLELHLFNNILTFDLLKDIIAIPVERGFKKIVIKIRNFGQTHTIKVFDPRILNCLLLNDHDTEFCVDLFEVSDNVYNMFKNYIEESFYNWKIEIC